MKQIDLVVCAYNEEAVIKLFYVEVCKVIESLPQYRFKIIIVNDGSKDATLDVLLGLKKQDERLHIVDLSRNFGHEAALAAGLSAVDGDAAVIMDADLEDPPSLIADMAVQWESGFDVVNAQRASRKEDSFLKRWTAGGFYKVINSMSGKVRIPFNVGNYRLISRRVLDVLNALPEKNRVFRVLVPYLGFPTTSVSYARPKRPAGITHYNWGSMMKLAVDGITSATIIPLKFAINAGFVVSGFGFAYLLYIIYLALFTDNTVQGWPSMMAVILFLGGIQLIFLGVLGEYIGRIFMEVKSRPDHIIRRSWKAGETDTTELGPAASESTSAQK
jgi:polyisoprenyl-phosphate glycosyltransferase